MRTGEQKKHLIRAQAPKNVCTYNIGCPPKVFPFLYCELIEGVGRVDRQVFVQTEFYPYCGTKLVRVDQIRTYVQNFAVLF